MLFYFGFYSIYMYIAFVLLHPYVINATDTNATSDGYVINATDTTSDGNEKCLDNIDVAYINLDSYTVRNSHMDKALKALLSKKCGSSFTFRRFSAVTPNCTDVDPAKQQRCTLNAPLLTGMTEEWRIHQILRYENNMLGSHISASRERGVIGCWYSHMQIYDSFLRSSTFKYLLVLEDDVILHESFFPELKRLAHLVEKVDADWDVIRFSCWGPVDKKDLVASQGSDKAYRTIDRSKPKVYVWGGTHAVFLQRETVQRLYDELLVRGMYPIDAVLRTQIKRTGSWVFDNSTLKSFCLSTPKVALHKKLSEHSSIRVGGK